MFNQNPDLEAWPVPKNKNWSKSGFLSNIDDFLELYRTKKIENRKSCSNKFLGIPKAIQNRSKHSLRVPELRAPSTWSYRNFQNSKILTTFWKFQFFFGQIFRFGGFSPKNIFGRKKFRKIFLTPKKNIGNFPVFFPRCFPPVLSLFFFFTFFRFFPASKIKFRFFGRKKFFGEFRFNDHH